MRKNTYTWVLAEGAQEEKKRLCPVRLQIWHQEEGLFGHWGLCARLARQTNTNTGLPYRGRSEPSAWGVSEDLGDDDYADLSFSLSLTY